MGMLFNFMVIIGVALCLLGYIVLGMFIAMTVMNVWDDFKNRPLTYFFFPRMYIRRFVGGELFHTSTTFPPFALWLGDEIDFGSPEGITPYRYFALITCLWPLKFVVDGVLCLVLLPKLFSRRK